MHINIYIYIYIYIQAFIQALLSTAKIDFFFTAYYVSKFGSPDRWEMHF